MTNPLTGWQYTVRFLYPVWFLFIIFATVAYTYKVRRVRKTHRRNFLCQISELFRPVCKKIGALDKNDDLRHPLSQIPAYATALMHQLL